MTSRNPTILFVPGLWEGPTVFQQVISSLTSLGYPTRTAPLLSTGTSFPNNPSMKDDQTSIRSVVRHLVEEQEKEIIMVMHSAGGFLGSGAIEGLGRKSREAERKSGGVRKLVFLAAGIAPVGHTHVDLPFMDIEVSRRSVFSCFGGEFRVQRDETAKEAGEMHCVNPRQLLFNDLLPAETEKWLPLLKSQPLSGWNDTTTYTGWTEIPSVFLICENDQILPEEYQIQAATMMGSKIERCNSGHMVMLSMPGKVVDVVVSAAEDP
ncbi:uncharacterized protein PAC_03769 [Phialocephala subalpina]|uniref:AB hydrolase-1 domain-containing protein n=1 Tax=Phialocephala subalpina TaxID=576137 RepID=A0A1L7WM90_9HELO|nr:uncharacterized protein PAC_03769 [Phialocephala subalpina]